MPSKAVIRRFLLLLCAALASGTLKTSVRANVDQTGAGQLQMRLLQAETTIDEHWVNRGEILPPVADTWIPGGAGIVGSTPFSNDTPREPVIVMGAPLSNESAAVPLPPAAWTGLSGLAGLGLIGFVRNLRKIK